MKNTQMKPSQRQKEQKKKPSELLEEEAIKMQEKLEMVKKMMEIEKDKKNLQKKSNQGTLWRSATTQKQIAGYSQMVMQHYNQKAPPQQKAKQKEESLNINAQEQKQGNAVSNINKALQDQSEQYEEVQQFLQNINLEKYKDTFIENGIEDLEIILELDEKHLEQMSIPLGHKLKILKKIKDERKDKGMAVPESRQSQRPKPQTNTQIEPNTNTGGVGTDNQNSNLLEGQYNEQESHQQFLDALNAWRNAPKDDKKQEKGEKKVRFNDQEGEKKNNFFANIDNNENWDVNCLPQFEEKEIKPDPKLVDKKYLKKESCWNCYVLFPNVDAIVDQITKRNFCSQSCFDFYLKNNQIKCQFETCPNMFVKAAGYFIHGKWFCSEDCSDKDPETKEIKELYEKGIDFVNPDQDDEIDEDFEL